MSIAAAGITAFFVPPDKAYLGYYDFKTLSCLFCVLAVVGAMKNVNIFAILAGKLTHTLASVRSVCTALVIITMVCSMFLTNDTALLTLLPLSWLVLSSAGQERHIPLLFTLQNCAANLCGMIMPFGNPQNLYLFSYYNIETSEFLQIMLPPFLLSTALIMLGCLLFPRDRLCVTDTASEAAPPRGTVFYVLLFALAVAMVLRVVPYTVGLAVIIAALMILDRRAVLGADWGLIGTFAAFFTFSGNLARLESVHALFEGLLNHGVMMVSALTSQVISNVPAAILLSRFTDNYRELLLGVNIGGAGTLIASLASLITFREYSKCAQNKTGKFLALFSAVNFALLIVLLAALQSF